MLLMNSLQLKEIVLEHCNNQIQTRYSKIKQTIDSIEEALKEESKNSAGDKHETNRAMLQIDRENAGKQLMEIEKLQWLINLINIHETSDYIRLGSLVTTTSFVYFISISTGSLTIGNKEVHCIALNSPIGMELKGKQIGDIINFNQQSLIITNVQ